MACMGLIQLTQLHTLTGFTVYSVSIQSASPKEHLGQLLDDFSTYFICEVDIIRCDLDTVDNHVYYMCPYEPCGASSYRSSFIAFSPLLDEDTIETVNVSHKYKNG